MNVFNQIIKRIATLHTGEQWTLTASDLFLSRADFLPISVFLKRESKNGFFSVDLHHDNINNFSCSSLTIIKL